LFISQLINLELYLKLLKQINLNIGCTIRSILQLPTNLSIEFFYLPVPGGGLQIPLLRDVIELLKVKIYVLRAPRSFSFLFFSYYINTTYFVLVISNNISLLCVISCNSLVRHLSLSLSLCLFLCLSPSLHIYIYIYIYIYIRINRWTEWCSVKRATDMIYFSLCLGRLLHCYFWLK
jgi:hypothetical protein